MSAKKLDLAIDMLGLNIYIYPEHIKSYLESIVRKIRDIAATELLEKVRLH